MAFGMRAGMPLAENHEHAVARDWIARDPPPQNHKHAVMRAGSIEIHTVF
jgi:hypothetical protein